MATSTAKRRGGTVPARVIRRATNPIYQFMQRETSMGTVLVAVAAVALVGLAKLLPPISHADPVLVLLVGGSAAAALYVATLYALGSMPPELHRQFVLPLWRRLRPKPMVD